VGDERGGATSENLITVYLPVTTAKQRNGKADEVAMACLLCCPFSSLKVRVLAASFPLSFPCFYHRLFGFCISKDSKHSTAPTHLQVNPHTEAPSSKSTITTMAPPKVFPFPTPKYITGGCLCGSLRYRVDFPPEHDFEASVHPLPRIPLHHTLTHAFHQSGTCQCTFCRKQSGALFLAYHKIAPASTCFQLTSENLDTLNTYNATPGSIRVFCSECGAWLYFQRVNQDFLCLAVGTVDPLFLFGEGADGEEVPKEGFGRALVNGGGVHCWVANEIKGVTEEMGFVGKNKGVRLECGGA
jgi:hypothetical protein